MKQKKVVNMRCKNKRKDKVTEKNAQKYEEKIKVNNPHTAYKGLHETKGITKVMYVMYIQMV